MNELISPKYVICGSGCHVPIVLLIRDMWSELPLTSCFPVQSSNRQLPCGYLRHKRQIFFCRLDGERPKNDLNLFLNSVQDGRMSEYKSCQEWCLLLLSTWSYSLSFRVINITLWGYARKIYLKQVFFNTFRAWKIPWTEEPGRLQSMGSQLSDFTFTFYFHALEKEMAAHCSVLAWRIPGTGEPGGLSSLGSHRVGHDWSDSAAAASINHLIHANIL